MPERLHPGVYVEEVKPSVRAIEGVSTSTAAFIGVAERGPVGRATLITSFGQYRRTFGDYRSDGFLTYAVQNFFDNGGKKCYIVRVVNRDPAATATPAAASIELRDRERAQLGTDAALTLLADVLPDAFAEPTMTIQAVSPGKWGNLIDAVISDGTRDPENEFKIAVKFRDEVVETWDNLSMSLGDENFVDNVLGGDQSQYTRAAREPTATTDTPPVLLSGELDAAAQDISAVTGPVLAIKLGSLTVNTITLVTAGMNSGEKIATEIETKVRAAVPAAATGEAQRAFTEFSCTFVPGVAPRYVLVSGSDAPPRTIAVPAATAAAGTQTDVRGQLKLDVTATGTAKAVAIDGHPLQRGTSRSGNEPGTSTNGPRSLSFNLNRDGFQMVQLDAGKASGDDVAANIQAKVQGIQAQRKDPANQPAYANFTAEYDAHYELTFGDVPADAGSFTFAAPAAGTDLSVDAQLRLVGSVAVKPGLSDWARTLLSATAVGHRPKADVSAIADGSLRLHIAPPVGAAFEVDLDFSANAADLTTGEKIAAAIQSAFRAQAASVVDVNAKAALSNFTARYVALYTLTSGDVRTTDAALNPAGPISSVEVLPSLVDDIAPLLKLGLVNGGHEQKGAALLRPTPGEYHLGDNTLGGAVVSVTAGADGDPPRDLDYVGDEAAGTGLHALDKVTDVSIIAIPGVGSKQVVGAGFGYCTNRTLLDCFYIADLGGSPETDPTFRNDVPLVTTPTGARDYVRGLPTKNDYGAIYFPWVDSPDPIGLGKNPTRTLPPSGFVAGMYARIDSRRGVFKAPAGTETNLSGVLGLAAQIGDTEQDFLNPIGINVIRSFPASGTVIWGARTLSSDSAWRYVPVRRMAIFLRVSIYNGIQYAVFEPNDEDLWASLRLTIGAFMLTQYRAGAFQGSSPDKAFFVKCDGTTTTQADIDNGVVNILVGFAPLKPAEFVVLKLSQKAGQTPT